MKRLDYSTWDDFFMEIAESASKRSKDPSTQNGACIINSDTKQVLSVGYNGLTRKISDDGNYNGVSYWDKPLKYQLVLHAEQNAIINAKGNLDNSVLYLYSEKGYYPCTICSSMIAQAGIKEIVMKWAMDKNTDVYDWNISKHILLMSGINVRILNKQKGQ